MEDQLRVFHVLNLFRLIWCIPSLATKQTNILILLKICICVFIITYLQTRMFLSLLLVGMGVVGYNISGLPAILQQIFSQPPLILGFGLMPFAGGIHIYIYLYVHSLLQFSLKQGLKVVGSELGGWSDPELSINCMVTSCTHTLSVTCIWQVSNFTYTFVCFKCLQGDLWEILQILIL